MFTFCTFWWLKKLKSFLFPLFINDKPLISYAINERWDEGESFTDTNENGEWDEGETLTEDSNKNGKWDDREPFKDKGMTENTYNIMMTLLGAVMVFMFIIPSVPAALGNLMLPIMIGAKDVAFPRLNLASWYIYVVGSSIGVYSIISGGVVLSCFSLIALELAYESIGFVCSSSSISFLTFSIPS